MGEACLQETSMKTYCQTTSGEDAAYLRSARWYTLKVRTGGEKAAVAALRIRGFAPYCPVQKEFRRYSDRVKVVEAPVFPGYLFCRFRLQEKLPLISSPGVDYILGSPEGPTPVAEEEINNVRRMIDAGACRVSTFEIGERVRVTHGPLEGVEGLLVRDPQGSRLTVSIGLLRQGATLHIDQEQVLPIGRNH